MTQINELKWCAANVPAMRDGLADVIAGFYRSLSTTHPGDPSNHWWRNYARMVAKSTTLWWVSEEMTSVAEAASGTLPEWQPITAMPDPVGVVAYATGACGGVNLITWCVLDTGWMWVYPWSVSRDDITFVAPFSVYAPTGARGEWGDDPQAHESMAKCLSMLGSTWLIAQQVTLADSKTRVLTPMDHKGRERLDRRAPVTIVELRRQLGDAHEAKGGTRNYTHRWLVGGHWRQQACGPNRSQRRPKFIAPYVKGPAGAPLVQKDRVHVWRR